MNGTVNNAAIKQVVEVNLGGYRATFTADNLAILEQLKHPNHYGMKAIQDLADLATDLCCGVEAPGPSYCLQYLKELRELRVLFEEIRKINVVEPKGGER